MMIRRALIACGLLGVVVAAAPLQLVVAADDAAQGKPSGTIELASEEMRLIMGGTAGKGVLHFNGTDYRFSFKSASAGVGAKVVTEVSAAGEVYGLTKIEDFAGEYTSISKSAMAGSGEVAASYKNDKGVTLDLRGTAKGAGLSLGGGVATITLIED